ncbi:hypothetical protein ACEWY4_025251 [Coilia grayii]|uniref:Transcriptional-regulating factor 1-like n=1 Tax=Coilia grayii TaxID=363190 RepID=A0ABD1IX15_9TELE
MGDQSAFQPAESHPLQAFMSRALGHHPPKPSRDPFSHCSALVLGGSQFEEAVESGVDGEASECYSVGGLEPQGSPVGWGGQSASSSSSSSAVAAMGPSIPRARSHIEEFREDWASLYQEEVEGFREGGGEGGGGELGGAGGGQKLDSFSEAFFRRSLARHHADANGFFGMKGAGMGGSDIADIPLPSLSTSFSFPHVLSPPPTPLPAAPASSSSTTSSSTSPPRRVHLSAPQPPLPAGSHHQLDLSCGPLQFFPALQPFYPASSQSQTLTAKFPLPHWLQQQQQQQSVADMSVSRARDMTPPMHPGRDSMLYPEEEEFHLKQPDSAQHSDYGSADCSLQTPISSPLSQYPQSCTKPLLEPESVFLGSHTSWPTVVSSSLPSSLPICVTSLASPLQTNGHRPGEEVRPCLSSQLVTTQTISITHIQNASPQVYTGMPFQSLLQARRELYRFDWEGEASGTQSRYTPQPMLNPHRRGTGLFSNLTSSQTVLNRTLSTEDGDRTLPHRGINIGPEFQAELPSLLTWDAEEDDDEEDDELDDEQLLWKPCEDLDNDTTLQEQVERVLELCSSGAVPGGGTNVELALHCLHHCQGDIMAAVEMLLFSHTFPAGDYHYSGSDVWHLSEKRLFFKAYAMYGKEFSLISKMVKTKQVSQCVEFYYLSKRLPDKQRRQREREREQELEHEAAAATANRVSLASKALTGSTGVDGVIRAPSLATSFPCKQCGKMFYKIKSRNAHMKIHRQQQHESWADSGSSQNRNLMVTQQDQVQVQLQPVQNHQLLSQNLLQNLVQSQACLTFLQNPKGHGVGIGAPPLAGLSPSPNLVPRSSPLPLYPNTLSAWDAFPGVPDSGTLYYDSEGKPMLGAAIAAKGQVQWP